MADCTLTSLCATCDDKEDCAGVTSFTDGMGCVYYPCCFRCPFPDCRTDKEQFNGAGNDSQLKPHINAILEMRRAGQAYADIARLFKCSARSIWEVCNR